MSDKETSPITKTENNISQELDRAKLYAVQLKIVALDNKTEALQQRRQSVLLEASVIPERLKQVDDERKTLFTEYQTRYTKMKQDLEVPDGKELNLETGEIVNPNQL